MTTDLSSLCDLLRQSPLSEKSAESISKNAGERMREREKKKNIKKISSEHSAAKAKEQVDDTLG